MAKEEKTYLPAGSGGLIRFGEEGEHKIQIEPKHVIYIVVGIVVIELIARFFI